MSAADPTSSPQPAVYWPGVSVIVAARDAAATLPRCLDALNALDYPEFEVLVVDDGSRDETAAIAKRFDVRVLAAPRPGPSAARNHGVRQATHEIVAFTDADCVVPTHWLRSLVDGLRTSRAAGVGGPQRNVFPKGPRSARDLDLFFSLAAVVSDYARSEADSRPVDHNASCNVAYIKHTLDEVGGLAEDLFPGEDVDLDFRLHQLGYRCHYVPDAVVEHHRPGTREWFASMMRRYGRAQRALVDRHGRFRLLHYMPLAITAALLLQGLWLPRQTRWLVASLDALALAALGGLLASRVPLSRWPAVLDYALLAVREWHLGYLEGLSSPPSASSPGAAS